MSSTSNAPPTKKARPTLIDPLDRNKTKYAVLQLSENPLGVNFRKSGTFQHFSMTEIFREVGVTEEQHEAFDLEFNGEDGYRDTSMEKLRKALTKAMGIAMCDQVLEKLKDARWGDVVDFMEYRGCGAYVIGEGDQMLKSYGEFGYDLPVLIGSLIPSHSYYGEDEYGFVMHPASMTHSCPLYSEVQEAVAAIKDNPRYDDDLYGSVAVNTDKFDSYVLAYDFQGDRHWLTFEEEEIPSKQFNAFLIQMQTLKDAEVEVRERDFVLLNLLFGDKLAKDAMRAIMDFTIVDMEMSS